VSAFAIACCLARDVVARWLSGSERLLQLTQSDLAELVGASRERVNQVMVDFRSKGYVTVDSSHRVIVHQPSDLARLCR
jgi:CRP-like cAMP-binding protein